MTPHTTAVACALCGAETTVNDASPPPPPAGPADFDTRPAEPLRSTVPDWIQSCPNCGYCADDLTRAPQGVAELVASAEYRSYLEDDAVPVAARHLLSYSYLLERLHQHGDAGWSALHAAWVCDDAGAVPGATLCRGRTIELWQKGKAAGQQFADDLASEFALATDVYRRMGQFEHATVACSEGLDLEDVPPVLEQLLRRQMVLIQQRDTSAHSMAELWSN